MRMSEAVEIINGPAQIGYMVAFSRKDGSFLTSDHFPDKGAGEPLIESEERAWELAWEFAAKTVGRYVEIFVMDYRYVPVPGYEARMIDNRT